MLGILLIVSLICLMESNRGDLSENTNFNFQFLNGHFHNQDLIRTEYLKTYMVCEKNISTSN